MPITLALVALLVVPGAGPPAGAQSGAETALVSLADGTTDEPADSSAEEPDVSADGRTIAFSSSDAGLDPDAPESAVGQRHVYVRDREDDTTELVSLAPDGEPFPGDAGEPSVSGDGSRVAFTADARLRETEVTAELELDRVVYAAAGGLFVTTLDGAPPRQVPGTQDGDASPTVSPDGRSVAFVHDGDLLIADIETGLWADQDQPAATPDVTESDPAWSPDGVRIMYAFTAPGDGDLPPQGLAIVEVDTGGIRQLTIEGDGTVVGFVAEPAWSPDAEYVAFSLRLDGEGEGQTAIYLAPVEFGGDLGFPFVADTDPQGPSLEERRPAWSPDGERLVFQRVTEVQDGTGVSEAPHLRIIEPFDQSVADALTEPLAGRTDATPTWTRDGTGVVFSRSEGGDPVLHRVAVEDELPSEGEPLGLEDGEPVVGTFPDTVPTQLGPDTPLTVRADVRETGFSETRPDGPVEFRLCEPTDEPTACEDGAPVAPLQALADDPEEPAPGTAPSGTAAVSTPTLTPPPSFDQVGEWCWQADFLGAGVLAPSAHDDEDDPLCHYVWKTATSVNVDLNAFTYSGLTFWDVTVQVPPSGEGATPDGIATLWRCGPDDVTAAGCPTGGERVDGPNQLGGGGEGGPNGTAFFSGDHGDPPGRYCYRVEYSGDGTYQRAQASDPAWCYTHDPFIDFGFGNPEDDWPLGVDASPGGVDHAEPQAPGVDPGAVGFQDTGTIVTADGGAEAAAEPEAVLLSYEDDNARFYLCGPGEVTRFGCETGGTEVPVGDDGEPLFPDGLPFEDVGPRLQTASISAGSVTEEGVHCWRVEQILEIVTDDGDVIEAPRGYTDADDACFAVAAPYDAPEDGGIGVYVRDLVAGTTTLASVPDEPFEGPGVEGAASGEPSISDDGTRVAFSSTEPLAPELPVVGSRYVYVRDLVAETTTFVDPFTCAGGCFPTNSSEPSLSGDGGTVAYVGDNFGIVEPGGSDVPGGPWTAVYVHDLVTGGTTLESVGGDGQPLEAFTSSPSLDFDGDRLAFIGPAGLGGITGEGEYTDAVLLRDRTAATTTLATETLDGGPIFASFGVADTAISGDGGTVVFSSDATNLVEDELCEGGASSPYCGLSVFARDLAAATTTVMSVRADGEPQEPFWSSRDAAVAGTGAVVAFTSDAPGLVTGIDIPAETRQVYVRGRAAGMVIEPDPIDFGPVEVGETATVTADLLSIGGLPVTITDLAVSGTDADDFAVASDCVGSTLAGGQGCTLEVSFTPSAPGDREALVTVSDASSGLVATADLLGSGLAGAIEIDPEEIDFGERLVGTTSDPETATVTNTGTAPVDIAGVAIGGPDPGAFLVDDACGETTLEPDETCTIDVSHRPTTGSAQTATLSVPHDADGSPAEVVLLGGLLPPDEEVPDGGELVVSPDPVDFGVVIEGGTSGPRIVTVTNTGDADALVTGFTLTGEDGSEVDGDEAVVEAVADADADADADAEADAVPAPPGDATRFIPTNDTCTGAIIEPDRGCSITFTFDAEAPGAPVVTLELDTAAPANTVTLEGLVPRIEISPTLGPRGFVPEVTGEFFPPGIELELRWLPGIGITRLETDADGEFTRRVLVFRRDRIGVRLLTARPDGEDDVWATTEFLVVPGSLQPGDFTSRG